jgi:hypothetical protein
MGYDWSSLFFLLHGQRRGFLRCGSAALTSLDDVEAGHIGKNIR